MSSIPKYTERRMTMKKTIALLREHLCIEVTVDLSSGQRAAVRRDWAFQRCYRDQTEADVPYPFRPWRYYLCRSSKLADAMRNESVSDGS